MSMSSRASRVLLVLMVGAAVAGGCGGGSASTGRGGGGGTGIAGSVGSAGRGGSAGGIAGTTGVAGGGARGGTTGSAGTTGAAGTAADGGVLPAGDLGKGCAASSDCTGGLTCAAPGSNMFGAGGPPNGFCTRACGDADGGDVCGALNATCVNMSSDATPALFCMPNCTFGSTDRATKCRGRDDVGCARLQDGAGATLDVCVPMCSTNADCPSGRQCDKNNGLCVTTAKTGSPLGTACMQGVDGGTDSCAGFCLAIGSGGTTVTARFCSQACVLGAPTACNLATGTMSLAPHGSRGGCVFSVSGANLGDVGFCAQECDTATDCLDQTDPGATCDTSITSGTAIAPHGFCTW
jgi:Cys-rich repeat protein